MISCDKIQRTSLNAVLDAVIVTVDRTFMRLAQHLAEVHKIVPQCRGLTLGWGQVTPHSRRKEGGKRHFCTRAERADRPGLDQTLQVCVRSKGYLLPALGSEMGLRGVLNRPTVVFGHSQICTRCIRADMTQTEVDESSGFGTIKTTTFAGRISQWRIPASCICRR